MPEEKEIEKPARPSIRLEREFYKKVQKKMIDEGTDFQNLVIKLLNEWLDKE